MNDAQRVNAFDEIQSICRDFRKQLKYGEAVSIESFLCRSNDPSGEMLFQNLLLIELEFRRRRGDDPASEDYLKRFPEFAKIIRVVFFESTLMSHDATGDEEGSSVDTLSFSLPAARKLGNYELLREIGRGGFGVVYEARHLKHSNRVALKTLPTGNSSEEVNVDRLHRFRNEFRRLSEINHPNLVGMQSLEVDGRQWFFTMDLIDGVDFLSYVRPVGEAGSRFDEERLRLAMKQLVKGVSALHEHRIVHRDLKPSNVLVDNSGRLMILDFGLVAELEQVSDQTASMQTKHFVGTPRYAAPEQLFGQRVPATDWYSVGTMLYEALTGEVPFRGSAGEILIKKREQEAPTLSGRADLPADLALITDRLLNREPTLRPGGVELAEALGVAAGSTILNSASHGSEDTRSSVQEEEWLAKEPVALLIGREEQLAQLERVLNELVSQLHPVVAWISGRSGEGKSSLAEKFLSPLRDSGESLVLSGRCYDRESVPFKAIDGIIEPLVAFLRSGTGRTFSDRMPLDIPFLVQLFPLLRRVDYIAERCGRDMSRFEPDMIRARGFIALRELLHIISQSTLLVLFIDDLQWGDTESAQALMGMLTDDAAPKVLFLGSYRSDETEESPFLQTWQRIEAGNSGKPEETHVIVQPLTLSQCIDLAIARTGVSRELIEEHASELFADTSGNPYFIEHLTKGFDAQTATFTHLTLNEIIATRLQQLPENAAQLLNFIAVSGQPISIQEVCQACGMDRVDFGTLTHMRSEQLVRLLGAGEQTLVDTYHDKLRESVVQSLSAEQRKSMHLSIAETIESIEGADASKLFAMLSQSPKAGEYSEAISPRIFDMAHHFREAADDRAFVYQVLAGENALLAYAAEDALNNYEIARALMPENASSILRYRIWTSFARAAYWNHDFAKSEHAYRMSLECANSDFERGRACTGLASVIRHSADYDESIVQIDRALRYFGTGRSKWILTQVLSFYWRSAVVLLVPAKWLAVKDEKTRQLLLNTHDAFYIGQLFVERSLPAAMDCYLRSACTAIRTGEPRRVGLGYAEAAMLWSSFGMHWIAKILLNRSYSTSTEPVDPEYRGFLHYCQGLVMYMQGRLAEAAACYEVADRELSRGKRPFELMSSYHMHRHVLTYVGTSSEELDMAMKTYGISSEMKMVKGIGWGNYDIASALSRSGQVALAKEHMKNAYAAIGKQRFYGTETVLESTDAFVKIQCSDYVGADERATHAWSLVKEIWEFMDFMLLCLPLMIEARVGPRWTEPAEKEKGKRIKQAMRLSAIFYYVLPNHQPHLQRVVGRALYALGKHRKGIRKLENGVRLSQQKGMAYQQAKCLLDLAAVKEEGCAENRAEAIRLLRAQESVIPHAESWLLGDNYDPSLVAPLANT
jgi:serine/threonine protein kinase/tetratricopeptide (TPR) repeat protein